MLSHAHADSTVTNTSVVTVNEQTKIALSGLESADPDGDQLTYSWAQTAGDPVTLDSTTNPTVTFTTPAVPAGETKILTLVLNVDDGHGAYDKTAINVIVQHVNHPPILIMGKDVTVNEGDTVTISASATDPDNDPLTYSWGQFAGPQVSLSGNTDQTLTFTAPIVSPQSSEKLLFMLEANDGHGGKARGQIQVTVLSKGHEPAKLSCTDITVNQGDQVTLTPSISNPDNSAIPGYFWSQADGTPVQIAPGTSTNPTFTVPQPVAGHKTPANLAGQLQFILFVNDGVTYLPQCTMTVNIALPAPPAEVLPKANAGPDKTEETKTTVSLDGSASTGDKLQYSWQQTSGDPVTLLAQHTVSPKFIAPDVAIGQTKTLTFKLTVSNAYGQDSASVTITIENPNNNPTAKITVQ